MPKMVWAELGDDGLAVRLFKNWKAASQSGHYPARAALMLRSIAIEDIRRKVWERDKKRCTHCGNVVAWYALELHEHLWRGRGGEVSVENGVTLCSDCHQNSEVAGHGKRKVKWSK